LLEARVAIVAGFLCTEAIEAALPILAQAGIPVVATGVRTGGLTDRRDKTGWPVVRYAPRADAEVRAAGEILGQRWREELFAIIDDGTIYSRELAEGFRLAVEERGLKPAFIDTFRPQLDNQIGLVGRLRRSGATHVLAAGDRTDLAIIGRDAAQLGYDLTIAGGEVLRAAPDKPDLARGTLMIGLPEWAEIADPAVVAGFAERGVVPEGYVLPAYASVEVAIQAVEAARAAGATVFDSLQSGRFTTVLGPVAFDDKGDRTDNPYRLFRYDGQKFVEATE
jgi:branched-chain amino acid transport system substrate-binding protein